MPVNIVIGPAAEPLSLAEAKNHLRVSAATEDALITSLLAAARETVEADTRRALIHQTVDLTLDYFPAAIELPRPPAAKVSSIQYLDSNGVLQTLASTEYLIDTKSELARITPAFGKVWPATYPVMNAITVRYVCGYASLVSTVTITTDTITATGHPYVNNDPVQLYQSSGGLPAPLQEKTTYYVRDVAGNDFKLSATAGGAAIDLTTTGSGSLYIGLVPSSLRQAMLVMLAHFFENRELTMPEQQREVPLSAQWLMDKYRVIRFAP